MKKIRLFKGFFVMLLAMIFFVCNGFVSVFAAPTAQEKGFVEYQTEASINFNEIIEVVLTDKETGYYYTHSLYRVNDYAGNLSVPFGTYSVSAQVISENEPDMAQYSIVCLNDEIVVQNTHLAVPIKLKVNIATGVETVTPASPDADNNLDSPVTDSSVSSNIDSVNNVNAEKKEDPSLLISILFFLGILSIIVIVYLIIRWKSNRK